MIEKPLEELLHRPRRGVLRHPEGEEFICFSLEVISDGRCIHFRAHLIPLQVLITFPHEFVEGSNIRAPIIHLGLLGLPGRLTALNPSGSFL